jgi:hypothetical protein
MEGDWMSDLNYSMQQSQSVVVLAAGPSLNRNLPMVKTYAKKKESIVIACNYNFDLKADYAMFIGRGIYGSQNKNIEAPNFITTSRIVPQNEKHHYIIHSLTEDLRSGIMPYYLEQNISVDEQGVFAHHLSNCGFTALLAAHFFQPQEILIAGLDGPKLAKNKKYESVEHFNGVTRNYKGDVHTDPNIVLKKGRFLSLIFQFLCDRGIKVGVFDNERLWCAREWPLTAKCTVKASSL